MKYAAWDRLPKGWTAESVKKLWKTLTKGHKRKITRCMERMDGKVSDPGAYCGSLASQVGYRKGKKAMIVPEEQVVVKNTRRRPLFSDSVRVQFRKVFGVKNLPFFMFYETIRNVLDGDPVPEDGLVNPLRNSVRLITQMATLEATRVLINETVILIRPLLNRLEEGQEWDRTQILRFTENYANLMREICSGRGVFMTKMSSGDPLWPAFRKMTEQEQNLEELRLSDPEAYGNALDAKNLIRTVDRNIEQTIRDMGLTVTRKELMGRPVNVGTDPDTGEEFVFDTDGDLMTVDQFITKRKSFLDSQKHLTKTFPKIDEVRKLTDADVDALMGDVEYVAMTDDKAKANALTRIYAVRRNDRGQMVVVEGRFKGCYMDDLVNVSGRMIEGVSYQLDPKTNLPVQIDLKNPDGSYKVKKVTEPYATVTSKGELMIRLSSSNNPLDTHLRGVMKKLSTMMPGIKYEASSRNSVFTFHPQDFAAIRNALGGLALSQSAVTTIKEFFADQAKHDLATSEDNLQYFSADKIGGFKPDVRLFKKQKEAMAWLESRSHAGVIALDTGLGKTMTQIASMQKAIRDGFLEPGQKFLCVCPAALKNNLPKQAIEMLEDADALIERMDIMTYQEFAKRVKTDPNFANQYAAVYFDEAQALKNPTSGASKAASALKHPRKILLTASPMEKSPMEVLTLVAITNGMDLNTKSGRAYLKAFRERFCEEVGGKIIGIKNDPQTAKDFRIWVKQSLYFADKRDVEEIALPVLRTATTALTMDPEVEAKYREVVQRNIKIFQGMVSKYRDRSTKVVDPKIESARMKLAKEFKLLFELANMPWKHVPGARSPKMDHAVSLIDERVSSNRRTILFTDNPELASYTAKDLSNQFPSKLHAECGASTIILWKNGKEAARYSAKAYQDGDRVWPKSNWKGYVLDRVIQADPNCLTCVLTSSYAVGQNLQAFDTVIHLDRDAWNNETMKQRTARAWRTGQDHPVDEVVLDAVFSEPDGALDATADEIAKYMQQIEADIFQRVVVESQTEALGKDWFDMKKMKSSMTQLSRRVMLLAQSPYAKNLGLVGVPGSEGVAS